MDGHFQKAGFAADRIVECHGSIHFLQCSEVCTRLLWDASDISPEIDGANCRWLNELPLCPECGDVARPNILMFGDGNWIGRRSREQEARLQTWLSRVQRLVIIEVGAGTALPSIRRFGEYQHGFLIRINPREPELLAHRQGVGLALSGLEALRRIRQARG